VNINDYLNIIPLGYYYILIGMDWLDKYHDVLDCHRKTFACLDEEGNRSTMQGIPRPISIKGYLSITNEKMFLERMSTV
jgi:hypothetical protein